MCTNIVSLFSCHHKYDSATICMKPFKIKAVFPLSSSSGILLYLYYLASAPPGITKPNQACNE